MGLIDLEKAAEILGISPEELVEMRDRNEIHGYRDGSSWRFKEDEVKRVKEEMQSTGGDDGVADPFDDSSILVSEEALGESSDGATSTIIGKNESLDLAPESDIELGSDLSDTGAPSSGSGINLTAGSETGSGDDLSLEPGLGSDLELASDLSLGSDSLDDDLGLGDDDDEDDLVLGGSGNLESDITLGSGGDTGINLLSPSDSGLSLEEEPMELGSGVSSLELPEDDMEIGGAGDDALQADDEFMLSQPDEMGDDDDSGSQVIALEESAAFDQDAATMLQAGEAALLSEDPAAVSPLDGLAGGLEAAETPGPVFEQAAATGAVAAGGAAGMAAASMPMPAAPQVTEAPYSILNVLGLLCIILCLTLAGMLMVDVARNMWAWEDGMSVSTGMTDGIIGALGLNE